MKRMTTMIAAAVVFVLAGCSGGAPAVDDSPAGQAYALRQAVMESVAGKMGLIGGMARGEVPDDQAAFTAAAADLAALAAVTLVGFQVEGIPAGSRSTADIWANMADFSQKAADFQAAADAVNAAAAAGDFAGAKELANNIGGTCGGCHRPYRAPEQ